MIPRVGDIREPRHRSGPRTQDRLDQGRQLGAHPPLAVLRYERQIHGPQPLPGPVQDRHRGTRRHFVQPAPILAQGDPISSDPEHRLAAPGTAVGLVQQVQQLRHLQSVTGLGHLPGQMGGQGAQARRPHRHMVLSPQPRVHHVLRGPGFGQVSAGPLGQCRGGVRDHSEGPGQRGNRPLRRVPMDRAIQVPPQVDRAEQRVHVPTRLRLMEAELVTSGREVGRQRVRVAPFEPVAHARHRFPAQFLESSFDAVLEFEHGRRADRLRAEGDDLSHEGAEVLREPVLELRADLLGEQGRGGVGRNSPGGQERGQVGTVSHRRVRAGRVVVEVPPFRPPDAALPTPIRHSTNNLNRTPGIATPTRTRKRLESAHQPDHTPLPAPCPRRLRRAWFASGRTWRPRRSGGRWSRNRGTPFFPPLEGVLECLGSDPQDDVADRVLGGTEGVRIVLGRE